MNDDKDPEHRALDGLAEIKRELVAKDKELAGLRAQLLSDRTRRAVNAILDDVGVYPKAKSLAVRTIIGEMQNLRVEGDELLGSWRDLEGVPLRTIIEAFIAAEENEVFRPIEDEGSAAGEVVAKESTLPRRTGRTLEGEKLPTGVSPYFDGKPLHELPDEILMNMANRGEKARAAEPFKAPEGVPMHELTDTELGKLAAQQRRPLRLDTKGGTRGKH